MEADSLLFKVIVINFVGFGGGCLIIVWCRRCVYLFLSCYVILGSIGIGIGIGIALLFLFLCIIVAQYGISPSRWRWPNLYPPLTPTPVFVIDKSLFDMMMKDFQCALLQCTPWLSSLCYDFMLCYVIDLLFI